MQVLPGRLSRERLLPRGCKAVSLTLRAQGASKRELHVLRSYRPLPAALALSWELVWAPSRSPEMPYPPRRLRRHFVGIDQEKSRCQESREFSADRVASIWSESERARTRGVRAPLSAPLEITAVSIMEPAGLPAHALPAGAPAVSAVSLASVPTVPIFQMPLPPNMPAQRIAAAFIAHQQQQQQRPENQHMQLLLDTKRLHAQNEQQQQIQQHQQQQQQQQQQPPQQQQPQQASHAPRERYGAMRGAGAQSKKRLFAKDLKFMMYGFGDQNMQQDTIEMLEDLVVEYICVMTQKAVERSGARGRASVEDLCALVRKDRKKYARVRELLRMYKEIKKARQIMDDPEIKMPQSND